MNTKAFIFDLDGVIVDTAKYHYLAWKKIADQLGYDFTHENNAVSYTHLTLPTTYC
jgi:beta-phosphoglucomutase